MADLEAVIASPQPSTSVSEPDDPNVSHETEAEASPSDWPLMKGENIVANCCAGFYVEGVPYGIDHRVRMYLIPNGPVS